MADFKMSTVDVSRIPTYCRCMRSEKKTQVALRVDDGYLEDADALAEKMSRPGLNVTRTDVLRMAIIAGLKEIRRDQRVRAA
jgi:hypothetical protein